jgi:crossover junction endodeoxyribonuclease RuvC/BirA family biotin operon repressor/biotin-[acetyl-CoA-carboxylase] ligase
MQSMTRIAHAVGVGASRILRQGRAKSGRSSPGRGGFHASLKSFQIQSRIELRAQQMRSCLSVSEQKLWSRINACQLGVWFRRQVPLGCFIADFVAPASRLVVEVDGGYHARRRVADARRDRVLRRLGYRVLRIEAELVERDLELAVARIRAALAEPP